MLDASAGNIVLFISVESNAFDSLGWIVVVYLCGV